MGLDALTGSQKPPQGLGFTTLLGKIALQGNLPPQLSAHEGTQPLHMGLGGISLDALEGTGDHLGWPVGHSSPKVL